MALIISVIGRKNSGKTSLLECLIPALTRRGLRIGTLKHHHGGSFEADIPGKDSWRHAKAGAVVSAVLAKGKTALFLEHEESIRPEEIVRFFADRVDLVLTEGFSHAGFPIIEVLRGVNGGDRRGVGFRRTTFRLQ
jgi:molybdopterin-guanine dinucleotide biosynthesis protein B